MSKNTGNGRPPQEPSKGLPANLDAERFVLGSILLDADQHLAAVRGQLQPDDFTLEKHRRIYRRALDLDQRGQKVDRVTVGEELHRHNELESCDGISYLVSLDDGLPQIPNISSYINIVKKKSDLRRLAYTGSALRDRALLETDEPAVIAARVRQDLDAMQSAPEPKEEEPDEAGDLPFPEIAWRGIFADYRAAMDGTTEACDAAHFATFWAAVAVTLGRKVEMYAGEVLYPNVNLVVFGPTGDKKTTAERRISSCNLLEDFPHIRLVRGVGSTEGLADAVKDAETGVYLFMWEEFSKFLSQARWEGSTLLEFFTECFDCPPVWDKPYRNNKAVHLETPTPSILTATTPEWFWKHAKVDDFYGGFFNRDLFLTGPRKALLPNPNIVDDAVIRRIKQHLKIIAERSACRAEWTTGAKRTWNAFYMRFENTQRNSLLHAATKRAHIYVRKLAMTYAALEQTLPHIDQDQLEAAIAVVEYSVACTERLLDLRVAQRGRETTVGDLENRILKHAKKFPGNRIRYIQQVMSKYGDAEKFNRARKNLEQADRIEVRNKKLYLSI
jgi:hypothetical protein